MASINIVTDLVILLLPIRPLHQLHLNKKKRMALIAIFCTGGVAVIASIVRLNSLYIYTYTKDVSWDAIFVRFSDFRLLFLLPPQVNNIHQDGKRK